MEEDALFILTIAYVEPPSPAAPPLFSAVVGGRCRGWWGQDLRCDLSGLTSARFSAQTEEKAGGRLRSSVSDGEPSDSFWETDGITFLRREEPPRQLGKQRAAFSCFQLPTPALPCNHCLFIAGSASQWKENNGANGCWKGCLIPTATSPIKLRSANLLTFS